MTSRENSAAPAFITRFAPSPTGYLHLGHAYSALLSWQAAQAAGGAWLLRIEDIDSGRCRPEFVRGIFEDMDWLGCTPVAPVWQQSQRLDIYAAHIRSLAARDLLYRCFCTRKDIAAEIAASPSAPHGPDGPLYPGTCRTLSAAQADARVAAGETFAWRLHAASAAETVGALQYHEQNSDPVKVEPLLHGDVVLARKDCPTSYHLSVVVDDAAQNISDIIRGEDLRSATHVHRVLQALLGFPAPHYHHHSLVLDADGKKFSKRDLAPTLRDLRARGVTPAQVKAQLGLA